ncbi:hypothetical protein OROGR_026337 [Orobanche gracilis]
MIPLLVYVLGVLANQAVHESLEKKLGQLELEIGQREFTRGVFDAPQLAEKLAYFSSFFRLTCLANQIVAEKLKNYSEWIFKLITDH